MTLHSIEVEHLKSNNKSHFPLYQDLHDAIANLQTRFASKKNFRNVNLKQVSCILNDLASFPLGRHILVSGGANAKWTDYLISPQAHLKRKNLFDINLSDFRKILSIQFTRCTRTARTSADAKNSSTTISRRRQKVCVNTMRINERLAFIRLFLG